MARVLTSGPRISLTDNFGSTEIPRSAKKSASLGMTQPITSRLFRLQQHARDVIVLRSGADEKIEFGHQALQHFCRRK